VRPHLVAREQAARVQWLLDGHETERPAPRGAPAALTTALGATSSRTVVDVEPARPEIRLLTAIPRLEGITGELAPKRARRVVELVAYLALHRPDPVTGDRLRTRVLGNADVDAAAKTLFNTATAARRALGTGHDGRPLLPPAGRSGHYRLSSEVVVDVERAEALVAEALDQTEAPERIDRLRAALALVEGEPLSGALSGYSWWETEGHGGRIAAVLVEAACQLSELAVESGLPQLAAWGIGQARLVEPYSEALSCAAMRVAAASGDHDRLRREWNDCCRLVEELDPGGQPSERTERLFLELARRTPAAAVAAAAPAQASLAAMDPAPRNTVPSAPAAL
jgi:DNA-binding SARP family transcriptional activator